MKRRCDSINWQLTYKRQLAETIYERIMRHVPEEIWMLILSDVYESDGKSSAMIVTLNMVNKQWNRVAYQIMDEIYNVQMVKIQPVLSRCTQLKRLELHLFHGHITIPPLKKLEELILCDGIWIRFSSLPPILYNLNTLHFPLLKNIRLLFCYPSEEGEGPLGTLPDCMKKQIGYTCARAKCPNEQERFTQFQS